MISNTRSPSTGERYGVVRVTQELGVPRATFYRQRSRRRQPPSDPVGRRGPRTLWSDEDLVREIRSVLASSPFVGEGHRKVWARLRVQKIRTSKARVLRLMREHGLLAPSHPRRVLGPRSHDGTICTPLPDLMWGTDLTTTITIEEGQVSVFVAVDHCTMECVGIHAARAATRFEALEPIRQAVREHFGGYAAEVAHGLSVRHDHGSQYVSDAFQSELAFLGITSSPAFVRAPEGNGCAERFIRTLKEQLLWIKSFATVEELRLALHEFRRTYNACWLAERHGHRTPNQVRESLLNERLAA